MRHRKLDPEQAFLYYASLPPDERSRAAVAAHFSVAKSTVGELMARNRWVDRLQEMEGKAQKRANRKLQETLDEMALRHIKALQFVQRKAMQALREMPIVAFPEAMKAFVEAVKLERISRGEPDKKTEASLEVTLKESFSAWLERPDAPAPRRLKVLNAEGVAVERVVDAEYVALAAPAEDEEEADDA